MRITAKFWIGLGILALLSPFGLLLPEYFKSGSAWGEWGREEVGQLVGYLPKGLEKLSSFWSAPLPDYAFKTEQGQSVLNLSFSYVLSAVIGVLVCAGIALLLGKFLSKK